MEGDRDLDAARPSVSDGETAIRAKPSNESVAVRIESTTEPLVRASGAPDVALNDTSSAAFADWKQRRAQRLVQYGYHEMVVPEAAPTGVARAAEPRLTSQ